MNQYYKNKNKTLKNFDDIEFQIIEWDHRDEFSNELDLENENESCEDVYTIRCFGVMQDGTSVIWLHPFILYIIAEHFGQGLESFSNKLKHFDIKEKYGIKLGRVLTSEEVAAKKQMVKSKKSRSSAKKFKKRSAKKSAKRMAKKSAKRMAKKSAKRSVM